MENGESFLPPEPDSSLESRSNQQRSSAAGIEPEWRRAPLACLQYIAGIDVRDNVSVGHCEVDCCYRYATNQCNFSNSEQGINAVLKQAECNRSSDRNVNVLEVGIEPDWIWVLPIVAAQLRFNSIDFVPASCKSSLLEPTSGWPNP